MQFSRFKQGLARKRFERLIRRDNRVTPALAQLNTYSLKDHEADLNNASSKGRRSPELEGDRDSQRPLLLDFRGIPIERMNSGRENQILTS